MALSDSLYAFVCPNRSKSWRFTYRFDNDKMRLSPGRYPRLGLAVAWHRGGGAKLTLQQGRDPRSGGAGFVDTRIQTVLEPLGEMRQRKFARKFQREVTKFSCDQRPRSHWPRMTWLCTRTSGAIPSANPKPIPVGRR